MSRYGYFDVDLSGALDTARGLSDVPSQILLAQQRALGTLRRRLPVEARRDISAEYNLSASRINQGLTASNTTDGLRLVGSARGINAIQFGAQWTRVRGSGVVATLSKRRFTAIRFSGAPRGDNALGARFAIKRGAVPTVVAGTFIGRGKNGATLVFQRQGKKRLPLEGIYGPSIAQMLKHGRRPERLVEFARRVLVSEQQRLLGLR